jgi:hypothetical protein
MQQPPPVRPAPPAPGALSEQELAHLQSQFATAAAKNASNGICMCRACTQRDAGRLFLGSGFNQTCVLLRTTFVQAKTSAKHWRDQGESGEMSQLTARHILASQLLLMLDGYAKGRLDLNGNEVTGHGNATNPAHVTTATQHTCEN